MYFDEYLIQAVRRHRCLYDSSHHHYTDKPTKEKVWNDIGKDLKTSGAKCKQKWINLRDTYRRYLVKKAKQTKDIASSMRHKNEHLIGFIRRYLQNNTKMNAIYNKNDEVDDSYPVKSEATENEEKEEERNDKGGDAGSPEPNLKILKSILDGSQARGKAKPQRQTLVSHEKLKRRLETTDSPAAKLLKYVLEKDEAMSKSVHPMDAFLASIAPTLKRLSPYQQYLAKAKIFAVVQECELEMLQEQTVDILLPAAQSSNEPICVPNKFENEEDPMLEFQNL